MFEKHVIVFLEDSFDLLKLAYWLPKLILGNKCRFSASYNVLKIKLILGNPETGSYGLIRKALFKSVLVLNKQALSRVTSGLVLEQTVGLLEKYLR